MHLTCETMLAKPALIDPKPDVAVLRERYLGSRGRILRQVVNYSSRKGNQNIATLDIVSANGDVKADILYTRRYGDGPTLPLYKGALRKIYGIEEWDGIFDEWSATAPMRPVPTLNHFPFGAQSFSDLKQEARRTYQANRQSPTTLPSRILESDDMVAILNARGTVLLNLAFRNHAAQLPVIKLASLAVCLWGELEVQPPTDTTASEGLHVKFYQQTSAYNDVIQRAITMIRDDIHAHLLNATSSLEPSYMNSQQRHIKVLRETIATWQKMTNKRITPDWEDMADAIRDLREKCNDVLAYDSQAHRESLGWPGNLSVQTRLIEDHGSEWMGMLLRDENCRLTAREVEIQFLRRENSGFWFRA